MFLRSYAGVVGISTCEEKLKPLSKDLVLQCPDANGDCTWLHMIGNLSKPIETKDGNGNAILNKNDVHSFGEYTVITTNNTMQCFKVCPPEYPDDGKY